MYTKIINDFDKIAYKIQSKFNGNLTISKNSHDDSDFRIEVKFIWPDDQMKNAVKKFENKIEKMKIKFEKEEAIVRVTEIVNKNRLERIKKKHIKDVEKIVKQAKGDKVKFPKTWSFENMPKKGN